MNYRYEIVGDRMRMAGTLNSMDLPDLAYNFKKEAQLKEATAYYDKKSLIAERGNHRVSMKISPCTGYIQGKPVIEAIALVMNDTL